MCVWAGCWLGLPGSLSLGVAKWVRNLAGFDVSPSVIARVSKVMYSTSILGMYIMCVRTWFYSLLTETFSLVL